MTARALLFGGLLALLAGCAEVPVTTPPPVSAPPAAIPRAAPANPLAGTIDAWRQRALNARAAGDLATAETNWHVLTLLAPEESSYRQELIATRAAIRREVEQGLQAGNEAMRSGDNDRAASAYLRVLAVDPQNAEAARALREMDRRKLVRIQADRAAVARVERPATAPATRSSRPAAAESSNGNAAAGYDIEQRIEMFTAGDTTGGLRELRAWVEAHPQDRVGRHRVGSVVYDYAIELDNRGAREQALPFYETAIALRGEPASGWAARVQSVRKALSNDYYDRGTRAERTDLEAAVKALETSVRYDPGNIKASARLAQAKTALEKLKRIDSK